jgi:hypothetical protein
MPSVYEACKVNNNVKYFVHRTSRRGWAPKCYEIVYTFLLIIFFFLFRSFALFQNLIFFCC